MLKIVSNLNKKTIIIMLIIVGLLIILDIILMMNLNITHYESMYVSSNASQTKLYNKDDVAVTNINRGTKVQANNLINSKYYAIKYNNKTYFINKNNLVNNIKKIVLEKTMYVRTPVTITLPTGLSLIKKGEAVIIISHNYVDKDGVVNRYLVRYNNLEGYVWGKYLVTTKEVSLLNYDQEGNYQKHLKRGNTLGAGSAANLDFYPVTKIAFENNKMPKQVRSLYLNGGVLNRIDDYIAFAKTANINAFVVDIKDSGSPAYKSPVMEKYSPTNFKYAINSFIKYQNAIKKLKDNGFYVIGRITLFKDSFYINDHPENAILDTATNSPFKHNGSYWPSAFKRDVWLFNVELAKEAVKEMGFNEIQFDYVRFPDRTGQLEKDGKMDLRNDFNEEKAQAIQAFVMYAADELHQINAYISIDVFGESAHNYVTAYGQYWGAISNVVDVISPMPYPDHFSAHEYGFEEVVWTVPYKLISFWATNYVNKRQLEIPTPAVVRSWIQAFNTNKIPKVEYGNLNVSEELKALTDAGLTGGFMPWSASSNLDKYISLAEAFKGVK